MFEKKISGYYPRNKKVGELVGGIEQRTLSNG